MSRRDLSSYPRSYTSLLPVERALVDLHPSPPWRLYKGPLVPRKARNAGLLGIGTRKGRALLKRLAREEQGMRRRAARRS
jgi:hypothetical protein